MGEYAGGTSNGDGRTLTGVVHDLHACKERCQLVQGSFSARIDNVARELNAKCDALEAGLMTVNELVKANTNTVRQIQEELMINRAKQDSSVKIFVALSGILTSVVVTLITLFAK